MSIEANLPERRSVLGTITVKDTRLVQAGTEHETEGSGILDAVRDQHGGRWIRYGTERHAIWFAVADLISEATKVFRRLSSVGVSCITQSTQSALRRAVEDHGDFREALVASRPGWLDGLYLCGDGTVIRPHSEHREVIVTFEANPKFTPRGSLSDWQFAVEPFVVGQPLSYFALAFALTGPLLRFAPPDYVNPQVEIVGGGEVGKSTIGMLAASVWAGNVNSHVGGGESWDTTLNALDDVKLENRDGFVFLDEGNLAGADMRQRREFARQAVFKGSTTGGKRRKGDSVQGEHARVAILSTNNTALADLLQDSAEVAHAAQSRMVTIRVEKGAVHGVFASVPDGHGSSRAASEALRQVCNEMWGAASRAFIAKLAREVDRDEAKLRRVVANTLAGYMRRDGSAQGAARVQKTYALVTTAAALAHRWNIFPCSWGSPFHTVQAVARSKTDGGRSEDIDQLERVRAYVARHRHSIIDTGSLLEPLSREAFNSSAGFFRDGRNGRELLVPAACFQAAFADHEVLMRKLRDQGRAQTEGGNSPKLTIKAPRAICADGRVYCIHLD